MIEVQFLKDFPYSPNGYDNKVSKKDDKVSLKDDLAKALIEKGVCKACGTKPVVESAPKKQYENKMDSLEGKEEKAKAPKEEPKPAAKKKAVKKPAKSKAKK